MSDFVQLERHVVEAVFKGDHDLLVKAIQEIWRDGFDHGLGEKLDREREVKDEAKTY